MISMYLLSGLGNMMFQIAFIESLGKRSGMEVGYINVAPNIANEKRNGRLSGVDLYSIWKYIDLRTEGTNILAVHSSGT